LAKVPRWIVGRALIATALLAFGQQSVNAKPDVVVTLKPLHGLVAAVMEGVDTPHLLIDGTASPHTYAMKPSDVRRLNKAQVVIRVSKGLEVFLTKPLALVSEQTRVVTIDEETPGLTLLPLRQSRDFEAHAHDGEANRHHDHNHNDRHARASHDHEKQRHTETQAVHDTHLWLDPHNAKAIALHLSEVLAKIYPADADRLRSNGRALAGRLDTLDATLATEMAPLAGRRFLVFHDAYQYFERRYGLAGAGSVTISPEVPPSAHRLSEIRARIAKTGIVCVFAEPQFPPRAIGVIAEGTGVRQGTLDPYGAAIAAGPGHYFALLESIAHDLKACLGSTG
jgi:zinc transport system substrate-binding protein